MCKILIDGSMISKYNVESFNEALSGGHYCCGRREIIKCFFVGGIET